MADVIFIKGENSKNHEEKSDDAASSTADDDVWDDTALIRAYDRAVSKAKEEVTRRMGLNKDSPSGNESNTSVNKNRRKKKNSSSKNINKRGWKPGDNCRALYSADGLMYEATIQNLHQDKGTCQVTYTGYGNTEEVPLKMLQPSSGEAARKAQMSEAMQEEQEKTGVDMECSDDHKTPRVEKMDCQQPYSQAQGLDGRLRMHPMGMPQMVVPPPPPPHLVATSPENDSEALSAMLMSWYISGFHTGYYQGLKQGKNSVANGGNSSKKK